MDLSLTNRTVDLVDEGFDVVFRTGELPDSGLLARRLAPHRLVLCAAPDYLKSAGKLRKPLARPLHALYAPDRRMTPKLRSSLDFAVRKFGMK